jgi:adenylate cyclase
MIGSGLKSLILGLFMTLLIAGFTLVQPTFLESLQFKVYDFFLRAHPREKKSDVPVVVTLDEKTIQQFGQWPWPRYRVALLSEKIKRLGPASIGLDIMFPEPDRTSPVVFQKELLRDLKVEVRVTGLPEDLKDNDQLLARVLQRGPFVLSYAFLFHGHSTPLTSEPCHLNPLKTAMIKPSGGWNPADHLLNGAGVICTLKVLSNAAKNSGFVNTLLDDDGVIRRTPLLVSYGGKLYPSLAVANLMHAMGTQNVTLRIKDDAASSCVSVKWSYPWTVPAVCGSDSARRAQPLTAFQQAIS